MLITSMSCVDRPLDRVDRRVGRALAAEDLDRVEVGLRRDARADGPRVARDRGRVVRTRVGRPRGRDAEARGGARDVRAVAEAVERVRVRRGDRVVVRAVRIRVVRVADEVCPALDLRCGGPEARGQRRGHADRRQRRVGGVLAERGLVGRRRSGTGEVGVREVDAGVDHPDLDPLAVEAGEAVPHLWRADERDAVDVRRLHHLERVDGDHAGKRGEGPGLIGADPHLEAVVGRLVAREHLAAARLHLLGDRRLLRLELASELLLLPVGHRRGGIRVDDRDRIGGKLDDDGRRLVAHPEGQDGGREAAGLGSRRRIRRGDAGRGDAQRHGERDQRREGRTPPDAVDLHRRTRHVVSSPHPDKVQAARRAPQGTFVSATSQVRTLIVPTPQRRVNNLLGGL